MTASQHRTTGNPLARLNEEERAELRQHRLSFEVTTACLAWLVSRGLSTPTPPAAKLPALDSDAGIGIPAPPPPGASGSLAEKRFGTSPGQKKTRGRN
jgi:hypothetical protein